MVISYEEAVSRCWAEVDLSRLAENYRNAKRLLSPGVELICVLKADAYGIGLPAAARRLRQEGAQFFAVASCNEAMQLRAELPEARVLILGLVGDAQLPEAIRADMTLTVFSRKYARAVITAAKACGMTAKVHLKLETGLNRIGLSPEDALDAALEMQNSGVVEIGGVFTHLALRDDESDRRAIQMVANSRDQLRAHGIPVPMAHALDSIGMVRYPDAHMDAVRTGAWLYGVYPRCYAHPEESQLVLTVKTRVAQLHRVSAGECIGYDEDHPIGRDSLVATLSAGYIDGFPRLNSKGSVEIRGHRAPVVGLVCMDQMMVDVTDIPGVQEGDEAILLGGGIGVDEYAAVGSLNRNESLARTGKRVPRIYLENGRVVECIDGLM